MSAITTITGTGVLNAVPTTTTLTIGGQTFDLSQNRTFTGGSGITSIGLSVPTGFSVANSPLTENGTIALSFASGYALPTTVKQGQWDDSYTFVSAFPSQTGNSGKFLTTNGSALSWATVSGGGGGTPGGSANQIQFNNAGAFGGGTNVEIDGGDLAIVEGAFPSNPASGRLKLFADKMAHRFLMGSLDSSGLHYDFQPALFNSTTYMWLAGTGTTLAINWGTSYTARNNGTNAAQATPTKNNLSAIASMNRATFSTGTTATGASGIQSSATNAWRGNADNLGGFFFFARFGLETISGTYRSFVGLSENNATMNANASTWNNTTGIGNEAGDTTWFITIRSASTATRINTTITITAGQVLDFYMYQPPNGSIIFYEVRNAVTNASLYNGQESANLPVNTAFMYMQSHIQSVSGTTAKLLALNRMYLETNL